MKIKHKAAYLGMIVVSLVLIFVIQHTVVTYGVEGKTPYIIQNRMTALVFNVDDIELIEGLKSSIRETGQYYFFVGQDQTKEYASLESVMKDHPLGFKYAAMGQVHYLEVEDEVKIDLMVSSESNYPMDLMTFQIETFDGEKIYTYEGINGSQQDQVYLSQGTYFISYGAKANDSGMKYAVKAHVSLK